MQTYAVHRDAIALRKKLHCLRLGSLMPLDAGNGYIIYARFDREDCAIVCVNCLDKPLSLTLPVWLVTGEREDKLSLMHCVGADFPAELKVKFGRTIVTLPPKSGCVYGKQFEK